MDRSILGRALLQSDAAGLRAQLLQRSWHSHIESAKRGSAATRFRQEPSPSTEKIFFPSNKASERFFSSISAIF
ncbi:hypothetical protein [Gluconobacter sp. P5E10]|uniref:hypothetical protein n=1 Tax=Gluconobacter sp. P5E10 TaxID=2762613 RepID=UPI001C03F75A|nr:hypothetical protein [Gluconobacter sp. P5E10]